MAGSVAACPEADSVAVGASVDLEAACPEVADSVAVGEVMQQITDRCLRIIG